MIKNRDIIVFGADFRRHAHSLEHLMTPLFPHNRFLWVETIGLRHPQFGLYDFKRAVEILKKWFFAKKSPEKKRDFPPHFTLLAPFMIPFNKISWVRNFNKKNVIARVKEEMRRQNFQDPLFITSVPNACDYIKEFGDACSIYYCVDEFSLWPGLPFHLMKKMERTLLDKADLIFVTSDALAESKAGPGKKAHFLSHGVDIHHFSLPEEKSPSKIRSKICYYGFIDERCDQELLLKISQNFPLATLTLVGTLKVNCDTLVNRPNVQYRGKVSYQDLPQVISDQEIFILPYHINELTKTINPLKLKEYLCTGRPVLSVGLPEVEKLKDYLFVANNHDDFLQILQGLLQGQLSFASEKGSRYLKDHETWEMKAEFFSQITEAFLFDQGPILESGK